MLWTEEGKSSSTSFLLNPLDIPYHCTTTHPKRVEEEFIVFGEKIAFDSNSTAKS
jgi:hypothetical protein